MAYRNTGQVTGWLTCWSSEIVGGKALNAVSGFGGRGNCAPELLCRGDGLRRWRGMARRDRGQTGWGRKTIRLFSHPQCRLRPRRYSGRGGGGAVMTDLKVIDGKSPATRDPREQKFDSAYGEWAQALTDVAKFNESVECATEEECEAMNAQLCDRRCSPRASA